MPIMEWHEGMKVGVQLIDDDHKYLVDRVNEAFDAAAQDRGHEILGEMIRDMVAFCIYHFEHEEHLFNQTTYPEAQEHTQKHREFAQNVMDMQRKYTFGPTNDLLNELLFFLKDLMMNHAQGMDRGYVPYLLAKGFT